MVLAVVARLLKNAALEVVREDYRKACFYVVVVRLLASRLAFCPRREVSAPLIAVPACRTFVRCAGAPLLTSVVGYLTGLDPDVTCSVLVSILHFTIDDRIQGLETVKITELIRISRFRKLCTLARALL